MLLGHAANANPVKTLDDLSYPRVANYYLKWKISNAEAEQLARWDLVILPVWTPFFNNEVIPILRKKNPNIVILAYVLTEELPVTAVSYPEGHPYRALYEEVDKNNWWLYNTSGEHVYFWPDTWMVDVSNFTAPNAAGQRWNTYLAEFMHEEMKKGIWDGIYYDNAFEVVDWVDSGAFDLNRNAVAETDGEVNAIWREGMRELLSRARHLEGASVPIIVNSSSAYHAYTNGRLFESFPLSYDGGWTGATQRYFDAIAQPPYKPAISVINTNTVNKFEPADYRKMRFGLASALLNNGFYSFSRGDQTHGEQWWYDEYDVDLGKPLGRAYRISAPNDPDVVSGVWRRNFSRGMALVNATDRLQTISIESGYDFLSGAQDPEVNKGGEARSVTLAPEDGILLMKRLAHYPELVGPNQTTGRVYTAQGFELRASFSFEHEGITKGTVFATDDLFHTGHENIILNNGRHIYVYNSDRTLRFTFDPYGTSYRGTVHFALGDVDGDGWTEIITGTSTGFSPHIRIFSRDGRPLGKGFYAYGENLRVGAFVAAEDFDGDGKDEIVTAPDRGGGPHVRMFLGDGYLKHPGFFAYDKKFRGGVRISSGDVNGDRFPEIVTAPASGGGPHIRIWSRNGISLPGGFMAGDPKNHAGVIPLVVDADGDQTREEIIVLSPS
ncbi:MAG: putative glycoside hydrolase [Patescibacteria group bacterium]